MMKTNHFRNYMTIAAALILAFTFLLGCVAAPQSAAVTASAEAGQTLQKLASPKLSRSRNSEDAWKSNLLTTNPMDVFGIDKELIGTVTFLDSLEDAPRNAWNLGKGASSRVKGWVEWDGGLAHITIAAKGGVNGELCAEAMFEDCISLYEINFNGAFHTEEVESMKNMFHNCESLEYVDADTLDTSNVTTMYQMFRDCYALEELDVSSFDTSKVKNMYCMFSTCYSLTELDLGNFDTAKVTNMAYMFSACRALEYVDVSSFDTAKVTNMEGMFRWCNVLEEPDFSGWNVSRVRNYSNFMNEGMTINGQPWEDFFD